MKQVFSTLILCIFGSLAILTTGAVAQEEIPSAQLTPAWKSLLYEDLDGWEVFTGVPHKSVDSAGVDKSDSEDGKAGTPVGTGDPLKIFTVDMPDGEPILQVSGQVFAGLTTLERFQNYQLSLEYKWGEKKWAPRENQKRDSGLLIHGNGQHGAFWNAWLQSLECQIQESDTGDFIALAGTGGKITVAPDSPNDKNPIFQFDGKEVLIGAGTPVWGAKRSANHEVENWNRVDVLTIGDTAIYAVNGKIVMRLTNTRTGNQDSGKPLTSGRIQIQSEGAEISYRNIRIRSISELPDGDKVSLDQ